MARLEIKNLSIKYPGLKKKDPEINVIENLSITFEHNSFNVIIGPSGCGKTTLLKAIIGLIDYEGEMFMDGNDMDLFTIPEKNLAFVSQEFSLYPHMTIFDNIAFPLNTNGCTREEIIETVERIADELSLSHCLTRKPKQLSGGQQQRVALARAMAKSPNIYLFDEPLSNVDPILRSEERRYIKDTIKKYGTTAIYVTHDLTEATALADKLFVMDEGKIVLSGKPQEVLNSDHPLIQKFKEAIKNNEIL